MQGSISDGLLHFRPQPYPCHMMCGCWCFTPAGPSKVFVCSMLAFHGLTFGGEASKPKRMAKLEQALLEALLIADASLQQDPRKRLCVQCFSWLDFWGTMGRITTLGEASNSQGGASPHCIARQSDQLVSFWRCDRWINILDHIRELMLAFFVLIEQEESFFDIFRPPTWGLSKHSTQQTNYNCVTLSTQINKQSCTPRSFAFPVLLVTSNFDSRFSPSQAYLHSRVTCTTFRDIFPNFRVTFIQNTETHLQLSETPLQISEIHLQSSGAPLQCQNTFPKFRGTFYKYQRHICKFQSTFTIFRDTFASLRDTFTNFRGTFTNFREFQICTNFSEICQISLKFVQISEKFVKFLWNLSLLSEICKGASEICKGASEACKGVSEICKWALKCAKLSLVIVTGGSENCKGALNFTMVFLNLEHVALQFAEVPLWLIMFIWIVQEAFIV